MKHIFTSVLLTILIIHNIYSQPVSVLTQRYDNKRLGWNSNETILNTSNVNPTNFGLLFKRTVDDQIYAQPLVVANMHFNGGIHNVVFVATVNNTLYAFDADDSATMAPYWQVNLTPVGSRVIINTDMTGACGGNYLDFSGHMGIVGTPVIDTTTSTMYVVARSVTLTTNVFQQYLHAIDITTGMEKPGSPVYVTANWPGNGSGSAGGFILFQQQKQNQRAALMLFNGVVYVCWAAHCDWTPYHGWMIGFDANTLLKTYTYNDTPDGIDGGIWMSAAGPVVDDSGYIYITTGNGTVGITGDPNNPRNRGESLLKLQPSGDSMTVVDFFTPANYQYLEANDLDYGVDGPLIIPNTTITLSGSKEGIIYVVDHTHMGKYTTGNDSVLQILVANGQSISLTDKHIHGTPVYYHYYSQSDTECVYVWAESDSLRQFFFNRSTGLFDTSLTIKGNVLLNYGMPGSMLSVSSNSDSVGTGVVWATHPLNGNANQQVRPGRFDAYDARNIQHQLWNSNILPNRDSVGGFSKFNTPIVANGKVYIATFSNRLNVYGLLPTSIGINNPDAGNLSVNVHPNPSEGNFTLDYSLANQLHELNVSIVDLYGRTIINITLSPAAGEHIQEIQLPQYLSAGVYHAMFYGDQHILSVTKFVKY